MNRQYRIIERRFETENDKAVFGYAAVFNKPYLIYENDGREYYEKVDSDALYGADFSDVVLRYDHEGKVLARVSNGTLSVRPDDKGLFIRADLSKSPAAGELYEEIKNGLVTQMSWAFSVVEESFDRQTRTRTFLKIKKVYDVSAVTFPANPDTEIHARSAKEFFDGVIEKQRGEYARQLRLLIKIKLERTKT
ncbi:MAG: HK97 family phage prohead protease [Oscillospiraceae bacterium]|jgi:HK97 family phage prohead protease|nr:HK97 family phage prohead protease [Oscillospiraceae bacterium]